MENNKNNRRIAWFQLAAIVCLMAIVVWLVPTNAKADTRYLTGIQASYDGPDVLKGSYFSQSYVTVRAYYSDNTWEVVTGYTLSTYYISQTGANTITAYYGGMTSAFTVVGYEQPVITFYNVYFNSNGGTYISPIYNVKSGDKIVLPAAPTRYGYRFRGWYTTSSLVTQFTEETPITATTYLYAKWEAKAVVTGDTIAYSISDGTVSTTITANLAGQKYGPNVDLDVTSVEAAKVTQAVKQIASTDKFIAFEFSMEDYVYSDSTPLPVSVTIPSTFDPSKCAVYYTTNKKTIMGKMVGKLVGTSAYAYQFSAYEVGTYILIECQNQTTIDTPNTDSAYLTIEPLEEQVTVGGEFALIAQFYNYPGSISDVNLYWTSSNTSVADVDDDGIIYPYKKGYTTITVKTTDGKFKASRLIHVVSDGTIASRIKTNVSSKTLKKGSSFRIETTVSPVTADPYVTYTSSNTSVATVTGGGKVYAKKKGSCYIYVKTIDGSNLTKKIKITVK